jgi:group I intron endonuclease
MTPEQRAERQAIAKRLWADPTYRATLKAACDARRSPMNVRPNGYILYKITCRVTGEKYIGATKESLGKRWINHVSTSRSNKAAAALQRAIREHGREAFDKCILEIVPTREEALRRERELIIEHDTLSPNGLNCTTGGELLSGGAYAPEARERMSMTHKAIGDQISQKIKKIWNESPQRRISLAKRNSRKGISQFAPLLDMDEFQVKAIFDGKDTMRAELLYRLAKRLKKRKRDQIYRTKKRASINAGVSHVNP